MSRELTDFKESMIAELSDFMQSQARAISPVNLDPLIVDLPALRERFRKFPVQTYPYLPDQLEFLSLVVKEQVAGPDRDLASEAVAEAAFALLYFHLQTDLIPDSIPGMGLLDDAMIVNMVLLLHEHAFKRSSHAYRLHWPVRTFDVDQLLAVVSPLRLSSFYPSMASQPRVSVRD